MGNSFYPLNANEEHKDTIVVLPDSVPIFKVGQFMDELTKSLKEEYLRRFENDWNSKGRGKLNFNDNWINSGQFCEILQPGNNWRKGKIRLKIILEFCPDEPESDRDLDSPLNDIRQMSDNS